MVPNVRDISKQALKRNKPRLLAYNITNKILQAHSIHVLINSY